MSPHLFLFEIMEKNHLIIQLPGCARLCLRVRGEEGLRARELCKHANIHLRCVLMCFLPV